jgi:hypothetical protein
MAKQVFGTLTVDNVILPRNRGKKRRRADTGNQ